MKKLLPLCWLALLPVFLFAQTNDLPTLPTAWTPELLLQVKGIGDVQVAPDGRRVAFTVSEPVMTDEDSEYRTHLYLTDTEGSETFQFTFGEKSCAQPRWSPDGKWLAFTSGRSGKNNLWVIRAAGGEARQLTDVKTGVGSYAWSPDGSHIAFLMTDPTPEEKEKKEKGKDDAIVVDADYQMSHLWVLDVAQALEGEGEPRRLTEGDFHITAFFSPVAFSWSPDGKHIAFSHTPTPRVDDWPLADISAVEVETGEVRPLADSPAAEFSPVYSPDGQWLAHTVSDDPPTWAFTSRVHLLPTAGGTAKPLAQTHDEQPGIMGWSADSRFVYLSETHRTINRLSALPVTGGTPVDLSPADLMVNGPNINASGQWVGFTSEDPTTPEEVFVSRLDDFQAKQLTELQDLPDLPMGETEVIEWKSKDGTSVEGLVTYPVGYEKGQKVPTVVIVHGGPTGVFVRGFTGRRGAYPIASFADQGYAVLRCNVRGSSGYGREFRYANYGDWGGGDYQDILSGVDHLIEKGVADPDRLGIMGWSYGGFMTSWVITQTDRFGAASVGAGVTNLMSFTGTADIPGFIPDYFGGEHWDVFDDWASRSAMFNIKGVSTPTLIQHGEADERVPVTQGYELYNALKRQGVDTKMVVYPRQPHGIREPKLQLDAMRRNLDWFNQYLMPEKKEAKP